MSFMGKKKVAGASLLVTGVMVSTVLYRLLLPSPPRPVFIPQAAGARGHGTLVLFLSGAGGWIQFDQKLAADFTAQGFDVLGMDTLQYFLWQNRSPEGLAALLQTQLLHWMRAWGDDRLLLIGYSQGADVLPFVVTRLSPNLQASIQLLVLLGPAEQADFRLRLVDVLFNRYSSEALPLGPELQRLGDQLPVLCIYGENDPNAGRAGVLSRGFIQRRVAGGHVFKRNAPAISQLIRSELERVTSESKPVSMGEGQTRILQESRRDKR